MTPRQALQQLNQDTPRIRMALYKALSRQTVAGRRDKAGHWQVRCQDVKEWLSGYIPHGSGMRNWEARHVLLDGRGFPLYFETAEQADRLIGVALTHGYRGKLSKLLRAIAAGKITVGGERAASIGTDKERLDALASRLSCSSLQEMMRAVADGRLEVG